jgi:hypothetical protein
MTTIENLDSVMRRIAKLLAIAQDDRANPAEAAAAAGMAKRIMRKYQLDHSDIIIQELKSGDALETADCVASAKTNGTKVIDVPVWANWMATQVAALNSCGARIILTASGDKGFRFYGYAGDVQVAKYMFDYLVATTLRLCRQFKDTPDYAIGGCKELNSYRQGVALGICSSIKALIKEKAAEEAAEASAGAGRSLVVIKQTAIAEKYGQVFATKPSKSAVRRGDAFGAGMRDGKAVNVNTRGISGQASSSNLRLN